NRVRKLVPRAGLLGSLAAIALTLIAFLPLVNHIATLPLVGFLALTVILVNLVAHRPLPGRVPGALAALVLGVGLYHLLGAAGLGPPGTVHAGAGDVLRETPVLLPVLDWGLVWQPALARLPLVLPFALATIVGGLDCTE